VELAARQEVEAQLVAADQEYRRKTAAEGEAIQAQHVKDVAAGRI
jgi:hypothetical protein